MGEITKLPKWAQDIIVSLRRENANLHAELIEKISVSNSRVSIYDPIHATKNPRVPVLDVTYRFAVEGGWIEVGYDNHGTLIARADHGLAIGPLGYNSAQLMGNR